MLLCGGGHAASPVRCALGESRDSDTWDTTCGTCSPAFAQALKMTASTQERSPRTVVAKCSSLTSSPESLTSWMAWLIGSRCGRLPSVSGYSDQDAAAGMRDFPRKTRFSVGRSPGISSQVAPPGHPRDSRMWLVRCRRCDALDAE